MKLSHLKEYDELKKYANQMAGLSINATSMALKDEAEEYYMEGSTDQDKFRRHIDYIYTTNFLKKILSLPIAPNKLGRTIDWIITPRQGFNIPEDFKKSYIKEAKAKFLSNPENEALFTKLSEMIINPRKFS